MKSNDISSMAPIPAVVTSIRELTVREKLFALRPSGRMWIKYMPCQFLMVSLFGIGEAPISIASSPSDTSRELELCVRSAGNLTGAMHRLEEGSIIGIRGPYGNGLPMDSIRGKDIIIMAGGLGLAPLRSFINYLRLHRDDYGDVVLLIGAKRPKDLLFRDELVLWQDTRDIRVHVTVDAADAGWKGHVGVITSLLEYAKVDKLNCAAIVVGPPVMYRFVVEALLQKGLFERNIYLSLERRMRCGIGKCGHCQINGIYLCREGPVFSYHRLKKLDEAAV